VARHDFLESLSVTLSRPCEEVRVRRAAICAGLTFSGLARPYTHRAISRGYRASCDHTLHSYSVPTGTIRRASPY
jgi:hypothetical protein